MMIYTLELLVFVLVMVIVMDNCSREAVMMIPAKTRCPSTWTLEYSGYLMAEASAWSDRYNYYTKTFNGKSLLG